MAWRDYRHVPLQIVGFGFGASFVALFAQLGGGIYTKAADVGADLVGKVEAGIPEDDPRNPAVIADLVGDNVGDCAGRGADLFESTAAENVGAMILGIALFPVFGMGGILFPLLARAFGLLATIVGVFTVKCREDEDPMNALNRGYLVTTILAMVGFAAAVYLLLAPVAGSPVHVHRKYLLLAGIIGILTAYAFVWITQYYTEYKYRPVRSIAEASRTGPATNIISGLAVGFECTGAPVIVISAALMASYWCGKMALGGVAGSGLYGTAIATMGMLAPCAYILAMDTFGPITDNAGGIIEMSKQPEEVRAQDRPSRLGRQHHQGSHQGIRHRLGGPRGLPAVQRLPRRDREDHRDPHRSRPHQGARLRRRPPRRDARLRVQLPGHQGRRGRPPRSSSPRFAGSSGRTPGSWRELRSPTTRVASTS